MQEIAQQNRIYEQFYIIWYTVDFKPIVAYWRCMISLAFDIPVQIMVCRLFGFKPLPEPIPTNDKLNPDKHTSVKFEMKTLKRKCISKNFL